MIDPAEEVLAYSFKDDHILVALGSRPSTRRPIISFILMFA